MKQPANKRTLVFLYLLFAVLFLLYTRTSHFGRLYYPYHYRAAIESNALRHNLDPLLVAAVIRVESKFRPDAVSRKGAVGLMQVMPATAEWIAERVGIGDFSPDMLLDPEVNIRFGTWYLANLRDEFNGDLAVMIAAYNGGRGHVSRWLEEGAWDGSYAGRSSIPFSETRIFLYRVWTTYTRYRRLYEPRART
jgi:soluble lytic murein transglycosylase